MANFDYKCENCDRTFEKNVSISERDDVSCSECGNKVIRLISNTPPGTILIGPGFYQNDYTRMGK